MFKKIKHVFSEEITWVAIFIILAIAVLIHSHFHPEEKQQYPDNYDQYENCDIRRC